MFLIGSMNDSDPSHNYIILGAWMATTALGMHRVQCTRRNMTVVIPYNQNQFSYLYNLTITVVDNYDSLRHVLNVRRCMDS